MKKSNIACASESAASATTVFIVVTKTWQKKKAKSAIDLAKRKARRLFKCSGRIHICIIKNPPPPDSLSMSYSQLMA